MALCWRFGQNNVSIYSFFIWIVLFVVYCYKWTKEGLCRRCLGPSELKPTHWHFVSCMLLWINVFVSAHVSPHLFPFFHSVISVNNFYLFINLASESKLIHNILYFLCFSQNWLNTSIQTSKSIGEPNMSYASSLIQLNQTLAWVQENQPSTKNRKSSYMTQYQSYNTCIMNQTFSTTKTKP